MLSLFAIAVSALSLVSAVPLPTRPGQGRSPPFGNNAPPFSLISANCSAAVASATINFPAGQTTLNVPSGQHVEAIYVGRGTQNYTCGSTGTWTQVGALATLHDVTCLYPVLPSSTFFSIPEVALKLPNPPTFSSSSSNSIVKQIAQLGTLASGSHYFITEPAGTTPTGNQPKFDFTQGDASDTSLYVTSTKIAALADPTDATTNVPWLQLSAISGQGTFASSVFRVDTAGGQPTATCTANTTSFVDYAALYFFYK